MGTDSQLTDPAPRQDHSTTQRASSVSGPTSKMRFSVMELSGSLGDLGTFIPLTVALALATGLDIGVILVFAGLANIATGFMFGLPVPVQPMKAIAAVAIAEQLLPAEIAAAGLTVGVSVLVLGATGWIEKLERLVPRAVIRGIQLGIGIKLAIRGIDLIAGTPVLGFDSIVLAAALGLLALVVTGSVRIPIALLMFGLGLVITLASSSDMDSVFRLSMPQFSLVSFDSAIWTKGIIRGGLPQLPLTLLNSVLAVCALSGDLFPGRRISTRSMAISVGIMNLLSCPFGAMPMCHGSGGLAGQYRFGARTGGSVVMLGAAKLVIGLLCGGGAMALLAGYPASILGLMLLFAGVELAAPARDQRTGADFAIMLLTAIGILALNTAIGFVVGLAAMIVIRLTLGSATAREE
ncbi:MAG: putative sulfate/molybdate transporter [Candidatus Zixiibacteriota bacterium]